MYMMNTTVDSAKKRYKEICVELKQMREKYEEEYERDINYELITYPNIIHQYRLAIIDDDLQLRTNLFLTKSEKQKIYRTIREHKYEIFERNHYISMLLDKDSDSTWKLCGVSKLMRNDAKAMALDKELLGLIDIVWK